MRNWFFSRRLKIPPIKWNIMLILNIFLIKLLERILLFIFFVHAINFSPTVFYVSFFNFKRFDLSFEFLLSLIDEIFVGSLSDLFVLIMFADGLYFFSDLFFDDFFTLFEDFIHSKRIFLKILSWWEFDIIITFEVLQWGKLISRWFFSYFIWLLWLIIIFILSNIFLV